MSAAQTPRERQKMCQDLLEQVGRSWGYQATWTRPKFSGATAGMAHDYSRKDAAARYAACYLGTHGSLPLGLHTVLRDGAAHGMPWHRVLSPAPQDGVEVTYGGAAAAKLALSKYGYEAGVKQVPPSLARPLGPSSPTGSTRYSTVVVHEESADSTGPQCAIVVSRTKAGRYDVYARVLQTSKTVNACWTTSEVWQDLREPAGLSLALDRAAEHLRVSLEWTLVLSQVAVQNWVTAAWLANQHCKPWPRATDFVAAVKLDELNLAEVELLLMGVTDWAQEDILAVIERLGQMAGGKRSGKTWLALERKLFGDPNLLLGDSDENGRGINARLMDGLGVDIFKFSGIDYSDELHDAIWSQCNWQDVIEACPSADCLEVSEQHDVPGMSDVSYWIAIDDADRFARELRAFIVKSAQADLRRPRSTTEQASPADTTFALGKLT